MCAHSKAEKRAGWYPVLRSGGTLGAHALCQLQSELERPCACSVHRGFKGSPYLPLDMRLATVVLGTRKNLPFLV